MALLTLAQTDGARRDNELPRHPHMGLPSTQILRTNEGKDFSTQDARSTNDTKIGDIAGPILFNLATMLTKISLALFYLRLSPFQKSFRLAVYAVMCVSVVNSLLNALGFAWVCQPIEKYWDFSITTGTCINLNQYFLAAACINAGTDLALLILPIAILQKLHLPLRRKVGAALLLMTGSLYVMLHGNCSFAYSFSHSVCIISLIRVEQVVRGMKIVPTDGTWGMVSNFIWL